MKIILHTELELQDDATVEDVKGLRDFLHEALLREWPRFRMGKIHPPKVFAKHSKPVARQRRAG